MAIQPASMIVQPRSRWCPITVDKTESAISSMVQSPTPVWNDRAASA
jgi:hypothetical protein